MVNIDELLFRCHSLGDIMGVRGLGLTGKKRARHTYIEAKTGRRKEFSSNKMEKGIINEGLGIKLLSEHLNIPLEKNNLRIQNGFITGECDAYFDGVVYDIKSSWDLFTFDDSSNIVNTDYEWQLRAYIELYTCDTGKLAHVLTNAPDAIVFKELERESYKHSDYETPEWIEVEIIKSLVYDRESFMKFVNNRGLGGDELTDRCIESFIEIPQSERIKIHTFDRKGETLDQIEERVTEAREYLKETYQSTLLTA